MKILKLIINVLILSAVLTLNFLYFKFGWQQKVFNLHQMLDAGIKSIFTIYYGVILGHVSSFLFHHIAPKSQRAQTVTKLLKSVFKYLIAIVVFVIILTYFIEDTTSLFTGLSVVTLVVGLGMQSLINDIVAGIFIVFENDYQVGDIVVIDGWRGTVMEIGIRTTKIKDSLGNIQIINNSQISKIINNSKELSLAVCDIGTEYGEPIQHVEKIVMNNIERIKTNIPAIVEGPYYKGIASLADSAVVIRLVARCKEDDKYQVERDINREIKIIFDENKIGFPFPQVTISHLEENTNKTSRNDKATVNKFVDEQKILSKGLENQEEDN